VQSTPSLVVARSRWGTGVEGVHGSYEYLIPPHSFGLRPAEPVDLPENSTTATHFTRILFSHNHSLAASRPFLHPNFSPSDTTTLLWEATSQHDQLLIRHPVPLSTSRFD
jgi:hypothetical protein